MTTTQKSKPTQPPIKPVKQEPKQEPKPEHVSQPVAPGEEVFEKDYDLRDNEYWN